MYVLHVKQIIGYNNNMICFQLLFIKFIIINYFVCMLIFNTFRISHIYENKS